MCVIHFNFEMKSTYKLEALESSILEGSKADTSKISKQVKSLQHVSLNKRLIIRGAKITVSISSPILF